MKLGIIGQGAAALFLSLVLVKENKNIEITIFDKNDRIFKKLYATGNGKCNLANFNITDNSYNDKFAQELIKEYDANSLISFLKNFGVLTRTINNDFVYPYSLSARALVDYLIEYLKNNNVHFKNYTSIINYKVKKDKIIVISNVNDEFIFDKVVIDTGGKSSLNLGTDGSFFDVLIKHKYKVSNLYPGLVPIMVKEKIKTLENERIKVLATLIYEEKVVYKEEGEVIFKKDAISGIAMMNLASIIARSNFENFDNISISLDFAKDYSLDELVEMFNKFNTGKLPFLYGFFSKNIADYIYRSVNIVNKTRIFNKHEISEIAFKTKYSLFKFKELYPFTSSQVTVGGVLLDEINKETFESKKEKNVYLLGEVLNLDGLCGGYNISLCYAEAMVAYKAIIKDL